jgi:hypothetical protein
MPQLDTTTFFTQFFWFSLSFIFFYLFLLYYILPLVALNLKFRKELLMLYMNDIKDKSSPSIFSIFDCILCKILYFLRLYVNELLKLSYLWIMSNLMQCNIDFFFKANSCLLKVVVRKNLNLIILIDKISKL